MSMITKKTCPKCGSSDVQAIGSGIFVCKGCGYRGKMDDKEITGRGL